LYDAVLIPLYELDDRISELSAHLNDKIMVYCKAGSRSEPACQILAEHGFTKIYNMIGGIDAWMQADYPIDTSYHHVTVDVANHGKKVLLDIDPLLLYQTDCILCNQGSECLNDSETITIERTVLEQEENCTVTLITYTVDGATFEVVDNRTVLWSYDERLSSSNITASLILTELATEYAYTGEHISMQFYSLFYSVQHIEYNLNLYTSLTPISTESYNSSFTIINYAPIGKPEVTSLEFVEIDSSITLSQLYTILGKVAKKMGSIYQKSPDDTLNQFANRYYTMGQEVEHLSTIVKKNLSMYNKVILNNVAVLMDDFWSCLACFVPWAALCYLGCAGLCVVWPPFCLFVLQCADLGCNTAVSLACEYIGWCP
jgi:hypothetical protein